MQGASALHHDAQTRALEAADAMAELSPRCEEEWLAAVENYRRARAALLDDETARTLDEIRAERTRQDASWGEQNHESLVWAAISRRKSAKRTRRSWRTCSGSEVTFVRR
jgi:hypothetical protein